MHLFQTQGFKLVMQPLDTDTIVTCSKCSIIYDTDKFEYCPRCREQYDFDNGPWKNDE